MTKQQQQQQIDLAQWVGKEVEATDRKSRITVGTVKQTEGDYYPYPFQTFQIGGLTFKQDGRRRAISASEEDIVSIRPITILRWITDRLPTEADGYHREVLVRHKDDYPFNADWASVTSAMAWTHFPGWTPPAPKLEVKVPPDRLLQSWYVEWSDMALEEATTEWWSFLARRAAEWCAEQQQQQEEAGG